jgi:SAM-dependent methyltransferase
MPGANEDRSIIEASRPGEAWARWLATPVGTYMRAWEERACEALVADMFGYHALQCGTPMIDCLRANRMPNRVLVLLGPAAGHAAGPQVLVDHFEHLPFDTQSVDLVVLPHVLEFAEEPHQVLREVDRVLRPEGRLLVTGFNPVSLWGVRQSGCRLLRREWLPEPAQLITLARLRDWLRLLGHSTDEVVHGCYRPACDTDRWLDRFGFLEQAGDRWWPILGSVYILSAVKHVPGMRLQGPVLRKRFSRRVAAPVASHRDTYSRETVAADSSDRRARPEA